MTPGLPRVIVTSSRDLLDCGLVWETLDDTFEELGAFLLVDGQCATGGDFYAAEWAGEHRHLGVDREPNPADWSLGRRGGPIRNSLMVRKGARRCYGFLHPGAGNQGTLDCLDKALRSKVVIPVRAWWGAVAGVTAREIAPDELERLIEAKRKGRR